MIVLWVLAGVVALFLLTVLVGAPYVPSKRKDVSAAFSDLYPLSDTDVLLDIGSGDGVVLRQAAAYGARAVGYEVNPVLVVVSWLLSRGQPLVHTRIANFWYTDFPVDTTVVYVFGETRDIARMARRVQAEAKRLGRPLQLISYSFEVPGKKPLASTNMHHLYEFR